LLVQLQKRLAELDARHAKIEEAGGDLQIERSEFAEQKADLEQSLAGIATKKTELEERSRQLAEQQSELAANTSQLEEQRQALKKREQALQRQRRSVAGVDPGNARDVQVTHCVSFLLGVRDGRPGPPAWLRSGSLGYAPRPIGLGKRWRRPKR